MKEHKCPAAAYLASLGPGSRRAMAQAVGRVAELAGGRAEAQGTTATTAPPRGTPDTPSPPNKPAQVTTESTSEGTAGGTSVGGGVDWTRLDGERALAVRRHLTEHYAPATTNKMLAAMRGVMRAARDLGLIDEAHYQQVARVRSVKTAREDRRTVLTQAQLARLFRLAAADPTATGRRDAALLAVFLATGLRRAEAAELNLGDVDLGGRALHVRGTEPDRVRTSPLDDGAAAALADWVHVRGDNPGPLFLPTVRGGALRIRRLTDQAVYLMVRDLGRRAGLPELSTRVLRHTMIVRTIAAGADREALARRVGHMSWLNAKAFEELAADARRLRADTSRLPYTPPGTPGSPATPGSRGTSGSSGDPPRTRSKPK